MDSADRISKRRAQVPQQYRILFDKVIGGKAPPRQAIKLSCLECMGYVRSEVKHCDTVTCPLNSYKPYRKSAEVSDRRGSVIQRPRSALEGDSGT